MILGVFRRPFPALPRLALPCPTLPCRSFDCLEPRERGRVGVWSEERRRDEIMELVGWCLLRFDWLGGRGKKRWCLRNARGKKRRGAEESVCERRGMGLVGIVE